MRKANCSDDRKVIVSVSGRVRVEPQFSVSPRTPVLLTSTFTFYVYPDLMKTHTFVFVGVGVRKRMCESVCESV